jgi:nucleoside-diphosphate-sugar epimerase
MDILVVGGAGFIGHHVVKILKDTGHNVHVLDMLTSYDWDDTEKYNQLISARRAYADIDYICTDSIQTATLTQVYDVVIHLASFPRAKIVNNNPGAGADTMITGLINLLEQSDRIGRFVYISSSMVYGDFTGGITEDADCKPGSIYASLKLAGEQITKQYAQNRGFDYTIVRPSGVYGARDVEDRVVSKFFMNAVLGHDIAVHGETEQMDFSYIDDTAQGIVLAALAPEACQQTFNISYGQAITIYSAAQYIRQIVNNNTLIDIQERNPLMPSRGHLSIKKAKTMLGYNPVTPVHQGFKMYYQWIQDYYKLANN